ncbi:IMP cyclohydrolase [Streptomyces sp. NPDC048428]|uniref:IMP cyclohydrolase n=1 Tax=Streptomyces sp. NPDC048428 TaxID=3154503 RepID=UPI003420F318
MTDLSTLLAENRYPGRGVLCARTLSGDVYGGYFLTGRSAASRDRTLLPQGDELVVAPAAATAHDALRHYVAAQQTADWLVFGNGEQVSTVADRLHAGASAADSLGDLAYEPDPPILTSRITALLSRRAPNAAVFGAARPSSGSRTSANVMTLTVKDLEPGEVVLLTTYRSDGVDVATAQPFAESVTRARTPEELLDELWTSLSEEYRIAAAVLDPAASPGAALLRSA